MFKIEQFFGAGGVYPKRWWNFAQADILMDKDINRILLEEGLPQVPSSLFNAANIKYILTESDAPQRKNFKLVYDDDIKIYENKTVLPRAYMSFSKIDASGIEDSRRIFYQNPEFNENLHVVVENASAFPIEDKNNSGKAEVLITHYQEDKVKLTVSNNKKGILVLTDSFYPGWKVFVDGKESPIYPVNIMFKGVIVDAGEHTITFIYRPAWFVPTILITISSVLLCLFLICFEKTKAKWVIRV